MKGLRPHMKVRRDLEHPIEEGAASMVLHAATEEAVWIEGLRLLSVTDEQVRNNLQKG